MSKFRPISRDEEWCRACVHWDTAGDHRVEAQEGQCRRHAPRPPLLEKKPTNEKFHADWPYTRPADYCGDFQWDATIDEWIDDPELNPKD